MYLLFKTGLPTLLSDNESTIKVFNEDDLNYKCVVGSKPRLTSFEWTGNSDGLFSKTRENPEIEGKLYVETNVLSWATSDIEERKTAHNSKVFCTATNGHGEDLNKAYIMNVECK